MLTIVEQQFRQASRHLIISSASHPAINKFSGLRALVVFCTLVLLPPPPTVYAIDLSGIVIVPCGAETSYGPDVALNTTFLLRDCYNSPVNTGLDVQLNSTSGALSGMFIVVENSNRVYVVVQGVSITTSPSHQITSITASISNMIVVFRNVKNDIAAEKSMFRVATFSVVSNSSIHVSNVLHLRNTSIVKLNYVNSFHDLLVLIANASSSSTVEVVSFDMVADAFRDLSITLNNVTS